MQKASINNLMQIDLSESKSDEIAQYLQAILAVQYDLQKKGLKLKINRRLPLNVKTNPA